MEFMLDQTNYVQINIYIFKCTYLQTKRTYIEIIFIYYRKYYKLFYISAIYKMVDNSNSHVCVPLFVQTSIFESAYMMDPTKLSNHHGNPIVTRSGFNGQSTIHLLYLSVYIKDAQIIVYHFVDSCQESRKLFITFRTQVK